MLVQVPDVLSAKEVAALRGLIDAGEWVDGNVTSGAQAASAKRNEQLRDGTSAGREAGAFVLDALQRSPTFLSAALPHKVYPPLFNRYAGGQRFGNHVDNAIRPLPGSDQRIRTDVSATLFLSDADSYEGGELLIDDTYGTHAVKLPAGHMVVYPSSSLHRVAPVTRGVRVASFFWVQSMVRDDGARTLLYELDRSIQSLYQRHPEEEAVVELTGVYHNLIRRWADI
ncbi:Fe2+-dependent dioxygenase [Parvularcula dongshanensis]|uniref:PKHD-type hydroxylase n=1 Tax=Parvularcula dongshanensis TaxID=1173995 RepID=A0A840I7K7_9PROT|nr:Fe2+-dependent dioxygenase [Parvularcula dongshanensis]MBB4660088.1 PKHD-type hydroxylase [Parvularcula dongshanensis]